MKKVAGKVGIDRLMKENAESVVIPIRETDLANFEKLAKQFGVLYAAAKAGDRETSVVHIISNVNYAAQLNAVMEAMGYGVPEASRENKPTKKALSRDPQERSSGGRGTGSTRQPEGTTPEKASVRAALAALDAQVRGRERNVPVRNRDKSR